MSKVFIMTGFLWAKNEPGMHKKTTAKAAVLINILQG
ncbi:hypothetical protein SM12BL3_27990 [Serratia marcescens]|nr:hypothetical protein SM12BL3_27990 [Serratia marcescens]